MRIPIPHGFDAAFAKLLWPLVVSHVLSQLFVSHTAGGYVDELNDSDAAADATFTKPEMDMTLSLDVHRRPPLSDAGDHSSPSCYSQALVARSRPDDVVLTATETRPRVLQTFSPSDAVCHQSPSSADRTSTDTTEFSEREEYKTKPPLSGIVHSEGVIDASLSSLLRPLSSSITPSLFRLSKTENFLAQQMMGIPTNFTDSLAVLDSFAHHFYTSAI